VATGGHDILEVDSDAGMSDPCKTFPRHSLLQTFLLSATMPLRSRHIARSRAQPKLWLPA